MLELKTLDGQTLPLGQEEAYTIEDEKTFNLSLDKMLRTADLNNEEHVSAIQSNLNQISKILQLGTLVEDGILDEATNGSIQYFINNRELFIDHGITEHINAKKLEKILSPSEVVFTDTEYPPTIEEMKELEVDIGKLYES